mgnify:CR=1 FL=1
MLGRDFDVDITPKVNLIKSEKNYRVIFGKTGEYMLRFYDLRKGDKKVLFEKKISVNPIPDPVVKAICRCTESLSHVISAMACLSDLFNRLNLKFFGVSLSAHNSTSLDAIVCD